MKLLEWMQHTLGEGEIETINFFKRVKIWSVEWEMEIKKTPFKCEMMARFLSL